MSSPQAPTSSSQWTCVYCKFLNHPDLAVCEICEGTKVTAADDSTSTLGPSDITASNTYWDCKTCTFHNDIISNSCEVCGAPSKPLETPELYRTPSETISEDFSISRNIARLAIENENGDVNAAAANLLLGIFPNSSDMPFDVLLRRSTGLKQYAGVTEEMARELLQQCGDDVSLAKRQLIMAFGHFVDCQFEKLTSSTLLVDSISLEVDGKCPICLDDIRTTDLRTFTLSCKHSFCRPCLTSYVNSRMEEGDAAGDLRVLQYEILSLKYFTVIIKN